MAKYKERLFQSLVHHGWEIVSCFEADEWWAEEHWRVRSVRDNWGRELVVSFLVDPQYDGLEKSTAVWAVTVNDSTPIDRMSAERGISLLTIHDVQFPESLDCFVSAKNARRRELADAPAEQDP